jgi:hypothetical protein
LRLAAGSPDYELALIESDLTDWPVDQVLQALRRDGPQASLPVGILEDFDNPRQAARLAARHAATAAVVRPYDAAAAEAVRRQVLAAAGAQPLGAAERRRQAALALAWLAALSEGPPGPYELPQAEQAALAALAATPLTPQAARFLGNLASADAQQALVEMAGSSAYPLAARRAAGQAFRISVLRHGVLLTSDQVLRQYSRYNESERQERAVQELLGGILDAIEEGK